VTRRLAGWDQNGRWCVIELPDPTLLVLDDMREPPYFWLGRDAVEVWDQGDNLVSAVYAYDLSRGLLER